MVAFGFMDNTVQPSRARRGGPFQTRQTLKTARVEDGRFSAVAVCFDFGAVAFFRSDRTFRNGRGTRR